MLQFNALSSFGRCLALAFTLLSLFEEFIFAQSFNASTVGLSTRSAWCVSQIDVCPLVCQSAGSSVLQQQVTCNPTDLSYGCTCVNGFSPDMAKYTNTIPYFICKQVFSNCVDQSPNDASAQKTCEQENAAFCNGGSTSDDITSVYKITTTGSSGSKATSNITLTLVQAAVATTSATSSSSISSTSHRSSSTQTTPTTSTSSSPSTSSPTTSGKSGISTGALAAAIVVPIVGVALIAVGLGFFLYRKRRAARSKEDTGTGFEKAELHGEAVKPHELPIQERFEMEGEGIPGEMQANEETAHEMGSAAPTNHSVRP